MHYETPQPPLTGFLRPDPAKKNLFTGIFFGLLLLTGLFIFDDFGLTWDEEISRNNGFVSAKYITAKFAPHAVERDSIYKDYGPLHDYFDKDYGVAFELPSAFLERALGFNDLRDSYLMRHLLNFLVFFVSVYFFYRLVTHHFKNWKIGLIGALLMVLSPRIFADSFFNSKDLVFMSMFAISTYTMVLFLEKKTLGSAFWHALATALTIDVRIMGILIPAVTIGFYAIDFLKQNRQNRRPLPFIGLLAFYGVLMAGIMILFWPFLWEDPIGNFRLAFQNMSKFRWGGHVLYFGEFVHAPSVPWHYIPAWIVITTPVMYTVLFLVGTVFSFRTLAANTWRLYRTQAEKRDLIFLALFFGPLLAVIVLKSVLYDAWRQMFFLYPAFLIIALNGLYGLYKLATTRPFWRQVGLVLAVLLAINTIHTIYFMVRYHPHQNVYFSFMGGDTVNDNFERDYWGMSYRQALEFILEHDKSDNIKVCVALATGRNNSWLIPMEERKRLEFVGCEEATYFVTEYRWHPEPYLENNYELYAKYINGVKIFSVFKLKW